MILKRIIDKIHFPSHSSQHSRSRNEATTTTNAERSQQSRLFSEPNLISKRNSHSDIQEGDRKVLSNRSVSSGNALCSMHSNKIHNGDKKRFLSSSISTDLENEIMMTCTDSIASSHDHDFRSLDDLNLHHDHNTRQLFRHTNHFSSILQQLNDMRK